MLTHDMAIERRAFVGCFAATDEEYHCTGREGHYASAVIIVSGYRASVCTNVEFSQMVLPAKPMQAPGQTAKVVAAAPTDQ